MFLAEKYHLVRYGRPITGDRYDAMKDGPVPSFTYDLFKKHRPMATPSEIYFTISAFPSNAHIQAERKAAKGKAAAFVYQIRWRPPVEGGRRLSPHCIEIPFAMQNHWQLPEMVGTGPELQPANRTSASAFNGSDLPGSNTT